MQKHQYSNADDDMISAYNLFMSFISRQSWKKRKIKIEEKIAINFTEPDNRTLSEGTKLFVYEDKIGWYLYLLEVYIFEPLKYEYFQGARVIPIFKRIGMDISFVDQITGIDKRIKDVLYKRKSEADALLFEILAAFLWCRNGYEVSFVDEGTSKTADLLAKKDDKIYNIECKRQSKTSDYTYQENQKRFKMLSHISGLLLNKNAILDIIFNVELKNLQDTFLKDIIGTKLNHALEGQIISNEQVEINFKKANLLSINKHLEKYSVKVNSPMLNDLIYGRPIDNYAFTRGVEGEYGRYGEGKINNLYVTNINRAYGVHWRCDAEEAHNAKARDIKSQLNKAVSQLDSNQTGVVHIGMETYDGPEVERLRLEKITKTLSNFEITENNLKWVYCSFFQGYTRANQDWIFDESTSTFSSHSSDKAPLDQLFLIVPHDADNLNNKSHWERPLP